MSSKRPLSSSEASNHTSKKFKSQPNRSSKPTGILGEKQSNVDELRVNLVKANTKERGAILAQGKYALKVAAKNKNLLGYNRLISDFGNSNLFGLAQAAFQDILENKLKPNDYTFNNMINACVHAGDMEKALSYFNDMLKYSINPTEITYTILIKGYSQEFRIQEAYTLLQEMIKNNVLPNIRTFNTILRGCYRSGEHDVTLKVIACMEQQNILPDLTSLDYITRSYALKLDIVKSFEYLQKIESIMNSGTTSASYYSDSPTLTYASAAIAVANSVAVLNDCKNTLKLVEKARYCISSIKKKTDNDSQTNTPFPRNRFEKEQAKKVKETKLKEKEDRDSKPAFTSDYKGNVSLFLTQKTRELEIECIRFEKWLKLVAEKQQTTVERVLKDEKLNKLEWRAKGVLSNGLTKGNRVINLATLNTTIDWSRVFKSNNPICIEVCSGSGEWISERARLMPNINWVAIEMRYERVFSIWSRSILNHTPNVAVIYGEAKLALEKCFADKSIQQIFVNYPDPPSTTKSKWRLIDSQFLHLAHKVLVNERNPSIINPSMKSQEDLDIEKQNSSIQEEGFSHDENESENASTLTSSDNLINSGTLCFVTDDQNYAAMTYRELYEKELPLFSSQLPDGKKYADKLPRGYGSSYYNRFWNVGHKSLRFYFELAKLPDYVPEISDEKDA